MTENAIRNALFSGSWFPTHRALIKFCGMDQAALLHILIDLDAQYRDDSGWFFVTVDRLREETGLGKDAQKNRLAKLVKIDLLEDELRGLPCRRFMRLNYTKIAEILADSQLAGFPPTSKPVSRQLDGGVPANIHIKEKTNNNTGDPDGSPNGVGFFNGESTPDEFRTLATKLFKGLTSAGVTPNPKSQMGTWANELRKLATSYELQPSQLAKLIKYTVDHQGEEYFPVVEAMTSFKAKFGKILNHWKKSHDGKLPGRKATQQEKLFTKLLNAAIDRVLDQMGHVNAHTVPRPMWASVVTELSSDSQFRDLDPAKIEDLIAKPRGF